MRNREAQKKTLTAHPNDMNVSCSDCRKKFAHVPNKNPYIPQATGSPGVPLQLQAFLHTLRLHRIRYQTRDCLPPAMRGHASAVHEYAVEAHARRHGTKTKLMALRDNETHKTHGPCDLCVSCYRPCLQTVLLCGLRAVLLSMRIRAENATYPVQTHGKGDRLFASEHAGGPSWPLQAPPSVV